MSKKECCRRDKDERCKGVIHRVGTADTRAENLGKGNDKGTSAKKRQRVDENIEKSKEVETALGEGLSLRNRSHDSRNVSHTNYPVPLSQWQPWIAPSRHNLSLSL